MPENIKQVKTYDGEIHDLEVDLTNYYNKSETDTLLNGKVDNSTLDVYYTTSETDTLLNAKADKDTTYTKSQTDSLLDDKADKANTYTDAQVDVLLANKADSANVYTKADTDTLLATKANADSVYTKAEADVLLNAKADSADVYTKTEVYTKSEVDTALGGKADTGVSYTKAEDDALLGAKADASSVYTKSEVDTALGLKANSADVYTITQTDGLLAHKASIDDTSITSTVTWSADKIYTEFQNTAKKNVDNKFSDEQTIVSPNIDSETQVDTVGKGLYFENNVGDWMGGLVPKYIASEGEYDLILEAAGGDLSVDTHNFYFHGTGEFIVRGHEVVGFPDYSHVIKSIATSDFPYTVTQDGWLVGSCVKTDSGNSAFVTINGVTVGQTLWNSNGPDHSYAQIQIPVKVGDVLACTSTLTDSNISLVGMR